jgi:alkyl sulfatase BDS1-like metallo-beta-lactamase superfamily hydrolase
MDVPRPGSDDTRKEATAATAAANAAVATQLPLDDPHDRERAERGRLGDAPGQVRHEMGHAVWDLDGFAFLDGPAPDTVNPSLWRQAQLNRIAGVFEVVPDFYQVRGLDLSNVTFVATAEGWLVIDPLTAAETARAALDLLHQHVPARPVHAVIYTHSHIDHFGGVRGLVSEEDVAAGLEIVAPAGFLEAAVSENVIAGTAMARRATYMYGPLLPRDAKGHVDAGLGKGIPVLASSGLLAPTREIDTTGTELDFGGVRVVFQVTPGTEAPAEMNFHFPDHRALCMAENCTANLHNLYTLRGAQVRDPLAWSKYIDEAVELFADRSDVVFASHHWPHWGEADGRTFLTQQRDLYRYLHDQTMRLANQGHTSVEIAEQLELPASLAREFHARDYYGTVNHNVKAVYQRYLGWFDGNPANLHPLPPVESSTRYVEWMGGADEVLRRARDAFDAGDYRWVAEVVNHVVFADPGNVDARRLQADTLEQLGYAAESGPWRDFYLTGAQELRSGPFRLSGPANLGLDTVRAMTTEMLLDLLGVRIDGTRWSGSPIAIDLTITDRAGDEAGGRWAIGVDNGALHATPGRHHARADAGIEADHDGFAGLVTGGDRSGVSITGDPGAVDALLALLDDFDMGFAIVEP